MNTLKKWLDNRGLKREGSELRKVQLKDVSRAMKRVYNPIYFGVRPKHHKNMTVREYIQYKQAVKKVYNPKLKATYNEFIDLDYFIKAKT